MRIKTKQNETLCKSITVIKMLSKYRLKNGTIMAKIYIKNMYKICMYVCILKNEC